eukprot:PhM_4_TR1341/c0_g1_i1/m.96558
MSWNNTFFVLVSIPFCVLFLIVTPLKSSSSSSVSPPAASPPHFTYETIILILKPHVFSVAAKERNIAGEIESYLFEKHAGSLLTDCRLVHRKRLTGDEVAADRLVDKHYRVIMTYATEPPTSATLSDDEIKMFPADAFDLSRNATPDITVVSANQAMTAFGLTPQQLNVEWAEAAKQKHVIKHSEGRYLAAMPNHRNVVVVNGFYPAMAEEYYRRHDDDDTSVEVWEVEFVVPVTDRAPFTYFRDDVLGATNPTKAAVGSVRRHLFETAPDLFGDSGSNGVHRKCECS